VRVCWVLGLVFRWVVDWIVGVVTFLSLHSFAVADGVVSTSEVVRLRAEMLVIRCEQMPDKIQCKTPISPGRPIQIVLKPTKDKKVFRGDHKFRTDLDGYEIEGTVSVVKVVVEPVSAVLVVVEPSVTYSVRAYVSSIRGDDRSTYVLKYLGDVSVSDLSQLNEISWYGQEIRDGKIFLLPHIVVGVDLRK